MQANSDARFSTSTLQGVAARRFTSSISNEIKAEELAPRHLLDVRIPDGWVIVEVERQFAATQFFLTEGNFGDGCRFHIILFLEL